MIHNIKKVAKNSYANIIRLDGIPLKDLTFVELAELYKDCSLAKNKTEIIAIERELQRREEIYLKNNWSY